MADQQIRDALRDRREVELTVTGRKSGRESTRPIWFVEEEDRLLLLPIHGSDTGWYRNIVATPEIRLAADGAEVQVTARTIEDADAVAEVVEKFKEKYGIADRVEQYYPKRNAFVEVSLS
jgi:deazaflavin-dependent oxidoreductase (nitroreductase family)